MNIIIEVKNVPSTFKPDPSSLRFLMNTVEELYSQAIYPAKLDGRVRAVFTQAKEYEFYPETGYYIPVEQILVNVYTEFVNGGMQPPMVKAFSDEAILIDWYADVFLNNTNNHDLRLPAFKKINLSTPGYNFGTLSK